MTNRRIFPVLRLLLGYGLAAAAIGFTAHTLGAHVTELRSLPAHLGGLQVMLCLLLMAGHVLLNREGFVCLCEALDDQLPPRRLRLIWGSSLLAKYVPGGIWQLVGRGALMLRAGSTRQAAFGSGVIEQAISLLLCIAIASCALAWQHGSHLLALCVIIATLAAMPLIAATLPQIGNRQKFLRAIALYSLAMPFYLAAYAWAVQPGNLILLTVELFAGTIAGMAAVLVPGGLGVREATMSLLADPSSPGNALGALILVRLIIIGVEILLTLSAVIGRPKA